MAAPTNAPDATTWPAPLDGVVLGADDELDEVADPVEEAAPVDEAAADVLELDGSEPALFEAATAAKS